MHLGESFYTEEELKQFGFKYLGKDVKIKRNVGIFFTENVSIGDHVRIDDFTIIVAGQPGMTIGSYVHIASHCYLAASHGIVMEDFSGISPGVKIFSGSDDYSGERLTNPTLPKKYIGGKGGTVLLKRHVIIGAGTTILPGCVLGEGTSVGAMSLVTKSLDPWGVYFGIPVRRLKDRKKKLLDLEREFLENMN
ncbi:MAG TPA: acyltransferase [Planktothrix sp. UBA10369]|jgi:Acetyltransferase (isoleucine patch superfamily)|nr:acyltransferase [Planktothrix sp. UBA10369]